jgi:hypothetical protein
VAMMVFCSTCASAFIVEEGPSYIRFGCFCCRYVYKKRHMIVSCIYPQLKVGLCPFLMQENIRMDFNQWFGKFNVKFKHS